MTDQLWGFIIASSLLGLCFQQLLQSFSLLLRKPLQVFLINSC